VSDPRVGRFAAVDSHDGFEFDPRTLHQYLYSYAHPTDVTDPTGLAGVLPFDPLDPLDIGNEVHEMVGDDFEASGPGYRFANQGASATLGFRVPFGLGRYRPDLVDVREKQLYEIKHVREAAIGEAKLRFYLTIFNWADPTSKAKKWTAGNKFIPSRYIKLRSNGGAWAIVSPPVLGVITYQAIDFEGMLQVMTAFVIVSSGAALASLTLQILNSTALNAAAPGVG
jgi:hypothetical protein